MAMADSIASRFLMIGWLLGLGGQDALVLLFFYDGRYSFSLERWLYRAGYKASEKSAFVVGRVTFGGLHPYRMVARRYFRLTLQM
ncbi:MAG: hypothetical protein CSA97_03225 [Bacteroidetes bacterium]|nr:MAG: hypothetical protein CSA97_03225 [Bacteroidota bacterium]